MFSQPFHDFGAHSDFLSEGGVLAVVVKGFSETPHQTRDHTDLPPQMQQGEGRLRLAGPPFARLAGAPHEREESGGSDPGFFGAGAPPGR